MHSQTQALFANVSVEYDQPREQILLIAPHNSYRTGPFISAANALGLDITVASEGKNSIIGAYAKGIHVDFSDSEQAFAALLKATPARPWAGIIATDDSSTELASRLAQYFNLPHNNPGAVHIARRKDLARAALWQAGLNIPQHWLIDLRQPLEEQIREIIFPCVVKPVALAASRGVIRVNTMPELLQAINRIKAILATQPESEERYLLLTERFIPGFEIAVEGMLEQGILTILTIFDKPDPLNGPFFEETYYITPTRLSSSIQKQVQQTIASACAVYGLREGPVHAECRINDEGVWILEVAARTIGGLCARLFRFGTGFGLEELVLSHASGRKLAQPAEPGAAGVLMIPTPKAGILSRVEGILAAQKVNYIEAVDIQVREGYQLIPLPEGSSYLGFIFARAPSAQLAEAALREAHSMLRVVVNPLWQGITVE